MIRKFLVERASWIGLFVFLQLLVLLIAYLDPSISVNSIFYYVFLSIILFTIFLFFRYQRESKFFKAFDERENDIDPSSLPEPSSPFEKIVEENFSRSIGLARQQAVQNDLSLEHEKDELVAWIHEVKTPLTAMHLIIDRINEEQIKKQLTYEWLRIHLLLDQQLHQKRIPSIENDLYIEKVDLEALVFNEIHTLRSWCMQKGIGFDVQLHVPSVLTDAKWLSFIIRQLLSNAVKYSIISSEIIVKSGVMDGHIFLSVTDNGPGIKERDLPRIYEKGFTSTRDHYNQEASGMGLYLAKKAADSLKVQMDVASFPEKGTTFTLKFPTENEFLKIQGV
ncbi:sensor histidine kinase [Halobacillus massiliensis]|uniref:sensor histidine kinase n=1 Tax=Halobacillus massiliensis TaxID=1926286 RepID=UPI0009E4BE51|nr:sensor histidine kinase [Halobacillus massiliensis]